MNLTESIKNRALELGFDLVGVTNADPLVAGQASFLRRWLDAGFAADMGYMHRNFEKRTNPAKLLDDAKSVICTGLSYTLHSDEKNTNRTGKIADFALYEDYHDFIRDRLRKLVDFMVNSTGRTDLRFKVCVDSVPIAERSFAQRAGLGFIGTNHMLTNRQLGSQILLGLIVTSLLLDCDKPEVAVCQGCDRCIRACPTGALTAEGVDSRKCISYLTIEHKGEIPEELAVKIGDRLFGCDECSAACPFTQNAPPRKNNELRFRPEFRHVKLQDILEWDDSDFKTRLSGSTISRTGLASLKRNARICLDNY